MTPSTLPPGFIKFWAAYPKKKSKGQALKAWIKNGCEPIADEIVAAVKDYNFAEDPQYRPFPSTWLNGWRWLDEQDEGTVEEGLDGW